MDQYRAELKVIRTKRLKLDSRDTGAEESNRDNLLHSRPRRFIWKHTGLVASRASGSRENQGAGQMRATIPPYKAVVCSGSQRVLTYIIWCIRSVRRTCWGSKSSLGMLPVFRPHSFSSSANQMEWKLVDCLPLTHVEMEVRRPTEETLVPFKASCARSPDGRGSREPE